jgi:cyclic pyranopterin phosphate synthase
MPFEGTTLSPAADLLSADEIARLVAAFARMGVTKVRLTGGEPTVRRDLPQLVSRIAQTPGVDTVAMTTNGVKLCADGLRDLRRRGLTHLNVSLDTLQRDRLPLLSQRPAAYWDRAWACIEAALEAGFAAPLKLNCVAYRGRNDDEIADFVELTRSLPVEVRFIELMPFAGNEWTPEAVMPFDELVRCVQAVYPDFAPLPLPLPAPAGAPPSLHPADSTAKLWQVPGFVGRVGFITTLTDAFCATCTRLRATADGKLKVCLHGNEEVDLRPSLRQGDGADSEAALEAVIRRALMGKHFALGGNPSVEALSESSRAVGARPMIKIGG